MRRRILARPKSSTLVCPLRVQKIFAGLMSRARAFGVSGIERIRRLDANVEQFIEGESAGGDPMLQGLALEKFHGNEGFAAGIVNFIDRADVRMIQRGGGFGFALEAIEGLRIFGYVVGRNFRATKRPSLMSSAL